MVLMVVEGALVKLILMARARVFSLAISSRAFCFGFLCVFVLFQILFLIVHFWFLSDDFAFRGRVWFKVISYLKFSRVGQEAVSS